MKRTRALIGGIGSYRNILENLSTRLRTVTALLKQGARCLFTPIIEATVREILREFVAPVILVIPKYDAVADNSHPFSLYCVTPAATALAPPSSRNNQTAPSDPSCSLAAPPWTRDVLEPPSTLKPLASFGPSSGYAVTIAPPSSSFTPTTRRSRISPK